MFLTVILTLSLSKGKNPDDAGNGNTLESFLRVSPELFQLVRMRGDSSLRSE